MCVRIVVRRQLRFDVRERNIAADSYVQPVGDLGKVQVDIGHYGVEPVGIVIAEQLLAEDRPSVW